MSREKHYKIIPLSKPHVSIVTHNIIIHNYDAMFLSEPEQVKLHQKDLLLYSLRPSFFVARKERVTERIVFLKPQ
jgi:hypothetical protein